MALEVCFHGLKCDIPLLQGVPQRVQGEFLGLQDIHGLR
jgi:hypothetical protein